MPEPQQISAARDWLNIVLDYFYGTVAGLVIIALARLATWSVEWLEAGVPIAGQEWLYDFFKVALTFSGVATALAYIAIKAFLMYEPIMKATCGLLAR